MTGQPYFRTAAQKRHDHEASKVFEAQVKAALGGAWIDQTSSTTEADFFHQRENLSLEVKEKRQRLTERWHLLPGVEEPDLFVLDELTVRKAMSRDGETFFLFRDVPGGRLFLADLTELLMAEHVRRNRAGKGKWIIDLRQFEELGHLDDLEPSIATTYDRLASECVAFGERQVEQV